MTGGPLRDSRTAGVAGGPAATSRPGRGGGRPGLVAFLVVLVLLFVLVDRVGAAVADRLVADNLQSAEHLDQRPSVAIRGFPLITQVLAQRYRQVDVTVHDLRRGRISVTTVTLRLRGVRVATGDLLSGHVHQIAVDSADGTALVSYRDIAAMLTGRGLRVTYAGPGRVRVGASVAVAGQELAASGTARVRVDGDDLTVTPETIDVGGVPAIGGALSALARGRLSFRLSLAALPFGVRIGAVTVRRDGVLVRAHSDGLVLQVG